ncbi:hypothetical protein B0O80DRAFT_499730 [Mortierella sp. GBAus27b]|nr:hypothetical protein BGX31_000252 [Mortierella sp. GBA43]KAI8352435.1 hypothetical protein B0O80DRAFT_499730 [Mortierella sp. GBAus27b]
MAQTQHALNIPEITFLVLQYLGTADIMACSLVCKSFHASFEPYAWMNIHLGNFPLPESNRMRRREPLARIINLSSCHTDKQHQTEFGQQQPTRQDKIVSGLQRIAPWIKSLWIHSHALPRQLRLGNRCSRIHTLLMSGVPRNNDCDETYWNDCEDLLTQNSECLRSLTLVHWGRCYFKVKPGQPLCRPLSACAQHPNLTTLRIRAARISHECMEAFWGICQRLEILELSDMDMEDIPTWLSGSSSTETMNHGNNSPSPIAPSLTQERVPLKSTTSATTTARLPKLRELTLFNLYKSTKFQLEQFILHCPLLQTLVWRPEASDPFVDRFCYYLAAPTWPCLDWIEIRREKGFITEQEHALLLQSAPRPLRRLDVNTMSLQEPTFDLYRERGHFTTLTKVDLTQSWSLSLTSPPGSPLFASVSKQVQQVLESCPMLEHIVARAITAQDITQGKPWVCRRLRMFEVMIHVELSDSNNNNVQEGKRTRRIKYSRDSKTKCRQVFERLGQLNQLIVLDMRLCDAHGKPVSDMHFTALPLRLSMGLGHLVALRNLELIGYHGPQEIQLADMEWMLQHWKNFKRVTGGPLSMKCSSKTSHGVVAADDDDDRSRLVMQALKDRQAPGLSYDTTFWRLPSFQEIKIDYCSESEGEVDVGGTE